MNGRIEIKKEILGRTEKIFFSVTISILHAGGLKQRDQLEMQVIVCGLICLILIGNRKMKKQQQMFLYEIQEHRDHQYQREYISVGIDFNLIHLNMRSRKDYM